MIDGIDGRKSAWQAMIKSWERFLTLRLDVSH